MHTESETLELKERYTDGLVRDMVAFLNTDGGRILIGVKDGGETVGVPLSELDETQRKVSDCITSQIEPNPQSDIKAELIQEEGKNIVSLTVNKGFKSLYCIKKYGFSSRGCLVRIGTTAKEMAPEEISYRYRLGMADGDDILKVPARFSPLSFDMMKILLVSKGSHVNETAFDSNFSLRCRDGSYNLMAELLSDSNLIPLIFVKFNGPDKTSIAQRSDYGNQSILLGYQRLRDRLIAENICKTDTTVRPRIDEYLYDMDCVNEALVNAIVHNDWTVSEPLVSFFDDRLEITSHGGLPKGLSKEEFFEGVSHPRNAVLMRIFLKLGIVEHTGHGVPRVISKYGKGVFDIRESFINVVIPFNRNVMAEIRHTDGRGIESGLDPELSDNERRVLLEIIGNPNIRYDELAADLDVSRRTVSRIFESLLDKGYIERVGSNKRGYWKVQR